MPPSRLAAHTGLPDRFAEQRLIDTRRAAYFSLMSAVANSGEEHGSRDVASQVDGAWNVLLRCDALPGAVQPTTTDALVLVTIAQLCGLVGNPSKPPRDDVGSETRWPITLAPGPAWLTLGEPVIATLHRHLACDHLPRPAQRTARRLLARVAVAHLTVLGGYASGRVGHRLTERTNRGAWAAIRCGGVRMTFDGPGDAAALESHDAAERVREWLRSTLGPNRPYVTARDVPRSLAETRFRRATQATMAIILHRIARDEVAFSGEVCDQIQILGAVRGELHVTLASTTVGALSALASRFVPETVAWLRIEYGAAALRNIQDDGLRACVAHEGCARIRRLRTTLRRLLRCAPRPPAELLRLEDELATLETRLIPIAGASAPVRRRRTDCLTQSEAKTLIRQVVTERRGKHAPPLEAVIRLLPTGARAPLRGDGPASLAPLLVPRGYARRALMVALDCLTGDAECRRRAYQAISTGEHRRD